MAEPTTQATTLLPLRRSPERERLERQARMLAWGGLAYHFVEFAIAIGAATVKEASQTQLCAYFLVALLIGLVLNAAAGLWWADPAAALFIAAVAVKEGRES